MIGTPGHILKGDFYEATRPGSKAHIPYKARFQPEYMTDHGPWSSHAWTLADGVAFGIKAMIHLWTKALKRKLDMQWPDNHPVWMREYLGRWAKDSTNHTYHYRADDDEGKQLNAWDPEKVGPFQLAKLPGNHTDWSYVYGMDLGYKDPFALVILAYRSSDPTRTLYQIYEFQRPKLYAKPIAELLKGDPLAVTNFGDSSVRRATRMPWWLT